ncbi:hypothetical protein ACFS27_18855 [Promicromonospora vindobonensis]|uniref:Uncharacterized protein n=1 Tax=Promicromonospora vindobonensis TaxID=195748 RepID=A0ABW5VVC9_9MICO
MRDRPAAGGRLILSVNHPTVRRITDPDEDYFATTQFSDEFELAGERAVLTFWHRPLHAMFDAFAAAGRCGRGPCDKNRHRTPAQLSSASRSPST